MNDPTPPDDQLDDFPHIDVTPTPRRAPAGADERGEISVWNFLVGYVLMIAALVSLATLGNKLLGIDVLRMVCISCGLLFTLAALGKPRILYLLVRNTGWFHHIRDPAVMRTILALLALFLSAVGFVAPNGALK